MLRRFFTDVLGEDIVNAIESVLLSNYKSKLMLFQLIQMSNAGKVRVLQKAWGRESHGSRAARARWLIMKIANGALVSMVNQVVRRKMAAKFTMILMSSPALGLVVWGFLGVCVLWFFSLPLEVGQVISSLSLWSFIWLIELTMLAGCKGTCNTRDTYKKVKVPSAKYCC